MLQVNIKDSINGKYILQVKIKILIMETVW